MKIWLCFLIPVIMASILGCATGYYESPPTYETSAYEPPATPGWYRNPETEAEYQMRLWREDAGSH
jgi:hypothetical protein